MAKHKYSYMYDDKEAFLADLDKYAPGLPFTENRDVLGSSVSHMKKIHNRLAAHPIEGCDAEDDGSVSEHALLRYENLAKGGSGVIWVESTAVDETGRTNARQFWIRQSNVSSFQKLAEVIHKNGCGYAVLQLTHAGRNSQPDQEGKTPCAFLNPYLPQKDFRIMTDQELDKVREAYVEAAVLAQQAGFDGVDVRVCHGYLLNELLAGYTRPGMYGISYENRTRLIRDIVSEIKRNTKIDICVRLNIMDGIPYPYGWGCSLSDAKKQDMREPLAFVKELAEAGVKILDISAGVGAVSPYMIRPYDYGQIPPEHPLESINRLLYSAKCAKEAAPETIVVASGFTWLREYAPMVAAGCIDEGWFDLAGFGRASIADPGFANDILENRESYQVCDTCGGCTELIKRGIKMRCVKRN